MVALSMSLLNLIPQGDGLFSRAARSSIWTISGHGGKLILRFGSNLILARLLFPEAFGLMALVTVVVVGLGMFSDVGIGPSIMQNARGDDPDFLDTAWTIQVIRGVLLWLATCALAWPAAAFYDEPLLMQILPLAGLSLLVSGFNPTRMKTANRHLMIGRVTALDLASSLAGTITTIFLALMLQSVWSLVIGGIAATTFKLMLMHVGLKGAPNRLRWEPAAGKELIRFGKWVFLSTICGFAVAQGDRAILGAYLTMEILGVYSIGNIIAGIPVALGGALAGKLMIPLYREIRNSGDAEQIRRLRQMRFALTGGLIALQLPVLLFGVQLIGWLYDPRYAAAGAIAVLLSCVQIPKLIALSYNFAALAAGDSKRFFVHVAAQAVVQIGLLLAGFEIGGLIGALTGWGVATILVHPVLVWLARMYGAWDPVHDAAFALVGSGMCALAIWVNYDEIAALTTFAAG